MPPLRLVIAAEEAAGAQVLKAVAATTHQVVAVLSGAERSSGPNPVRGVAERLGHTLFPARLVKDPSFADWLRDEQVDLLLNVHSLYIIHPVVLAAPRLGSFNLHPGPLPEYAGLNCVSWALYHGAVHYGVTLHRMEPSIDTGAMAYQIRFDIEERDTALTLAAKCVRLGVPLVERLLATAAAGAPLPAAPQDLALRRYYPRGVPDEGRLDWNCPASAVVNFVRACDYGPYASPWGHPRTRLHADELEIVRAERTAQPTPAPPGTIGSAPSAGVLVAASDEWVLVRKVLAAGILREAVDVLRTGEMLQSC